MAASRSNAWDTRISASGQVNLYDEDQDLYRW